MPERHAAAGLEPVDGLDQAERGDLDQVVHGLAAVAVAGRLAPGQRQAVLDDLVPDRPPRRIVGVQPGQCGQGGSTAATGSVGSGGVSRTATGVRSESVMVIAISACRRPARDA